MKKNDSSRTLSAISILGLLLILLLHLAENAKGSSLMTSPYENDSLTQHVLVLSSPLDDPNSRSTLTGRETHSSRDSALTNGENDPLNNLPRIQLLARLPLANYRGPSSQPLQDYRGRISLDNNRAYYPKLNQYLDNLHGYRGIQLRATGSLDQALLHAERYEYQLKVQVLVVYRENEWDLPYKVMIGALNNQRDLSELKRLIHTHYAGIPGEETHAAKAWSPLVRYHAL